MIDESMKICMQTNFGTGNTIMITDFTKYK